MPEIRKSADLRNNYGEISQFCHRYREYFTQKLRTLCALCGLSSSICPFWQGKKLNAFALMYVPRQMHEKMIH